MNECPIKEGDESKYERRRLSLDRMCQHKISKFKRMTVRSVSLRTKDKLSTQPRKFVQIWNVLEIKVEYEIKIKTREFTSYVAVYKGPTYKRTNGLI